MPVKRRRTSHKMTAHQKAVLRRLLARKRKGGRIRLSAVEKRVLTAVLRKHRRNPLDSFWGAGVPSVDSLEQFARHDKAENKRKKTGTSVTIPRGKRKGDKFVANGKTYVVVSYMMGKKRVRFARRVKG